jgi:hypothetical protein
MERASLVQTVECVGQSQRTGHGHGFGERALVSQHVLQGSSRHVLEHTDLDAPCGRNVEQGHQVRVSD